MTNSLNELSISETIRNITDSIENQCLRYHRKREDVRLMAVTKTVEPARVNQAIAAGITLLGENKAQELCSKFDSYNKNGVDIHFIGHLQSNKARQVIDKVSMIESLESMSLAKELQKLCTLRDCTIDCLIEVNIGEEDTKSGVAPEKLEEFCYSLAPFDRIKVQGLMSIPPISSEEAQKERYFSNLYKLFIDIRDKKIDNINMNFLSMGMSDDYLLAIKHGSNIVRIGSAIFGRRIYQEF